MIPNRIRWFVDPAMDVPELRSPQPCPRGIACNYKRKNEVGVLEKAWCKFVHPGEEGTGRSIWAEKRLADGTILPAVVRLSGQPKAAGGGWVQRLKERLPWPDWATKHGLQADTTAGPLEIVRIGARVSQDLSPLNPARPEWSQCSQGSQSHHRPLRIDLTASAEPLPVCASALAAPAQFPSLPPRLNLTAYSPVDGTRTPCLDRDIDGSTTPCLSNYNFRGPPLPPRLNLTVYSPVDGSTTPRLDRNIDGSTTPCLDRDIDGSTTPCLSNYNFRGPPLPPPRLNLQSSYERQVLLGFHGTVAASECEAARNAEAEAAAASFARGEEDDGCATPCLSNYRLNGGAMPPEESSTPRLPTTGENCEEGEMENLD